MFYCWGSQGELQTGVGHVWRRLHWVEELEFFTRGRQDVVCLFSWQLRNKKKPLPVFLCKLFLCLNLQSVYAVIPNKYAQYGINTGRLTWFDLICWSISRANGHCTYILRLRLKALLNAVVAQSDDVPRVQAAVPAHAHTVPQDHTHASRVVAHLNHGLDACNKTGVG